MNNEIYVRLANKDDLTQIVEIEKSCFLIHDFNRRQLNYLLTHAKALNLVIVNKQKLVGYCIGLIRNKSWLRLYSIAVLTQHTGLGSQLISSLEQQARAQGFTKISLEVRKDNATAQQFYTKHGYRIVGEYQNYYADNMAAIRMLKSLTV